MSRLSYPPSLLSLPTPFLYVLSCAHFLIFVNPFFFFFVLVSIPLIFKRSYSNMYTYTQVTSIFITTTISIIPMISSCATISIIPVISSCSTNSGSQSAVFHVKHETDASGNPIPKGGRSWRVCTVTLQGPILLFGQGLGQNIAVSMSVDPSRKFRG